MHPVVRAILSAASVVFTRYGKAYFDGSGDRLGVGDTTTFKFLHAVGTTGKWTIEMKVRTNSLSAIQGMFDTCNASTLSIGLSVFLRTTGIMTVQLSAGGANVIDFNTASNFITADGLQHEIQINYDQSLSSNNLKIFKDGVLTSQGTKTGTTPSASNSSYSATVGSTQTTQFLNGYLWGIRITQDQVRNTTDYTPDDYYTADSGNVALCMNFAEAIGATTFIDETGKTVTTYGNTIIVA